MRYVTKGGIKIEVIKGEELKDNFWELYDNQINPENNE